MRNLSLILFLGVFAAACGTAADDSPRGSTSEVDSASSASDGTAGASDATASESDAAPDDAAAVEPDASTTESGDASTVESDGEESSDTPDGPDLADGSGPDEADADGPSADASLGEDVDPVDVVTDQDGAVATEDDVTSPTADAEVPSSGDATNPSGGTEATLLCHVLCDKIWSGCDTYEPYGSDQDSCVGQCETLAEVSLDSLVPLSCMGDSCDAELCDPGDTPFPIADVCEEACGLFVSCDLMAAIQPDYPDLQDLCLIECSGALVVDGTVFSAVVHCIVDGLQESCDPTVMEQCFGEVGPGPGPQPEGPSCEEICDIATNFKCPSWSDGPEAWPEPAACLEDCLAFTVDPQSSPYTMYGCAMTTTCDNMAKCATPPPGDDPGCEALCEKAFQTCGDIGMPSDAFCTDYCTGQLMVFGSTVSIDAAVECLDLTPLDCDGDPYARILDCLLSLEDDCAQICSAMAACSTDPGIQPPEDCNAGCNAGYMNLFGPATTEEIATCIEAAADDCVAQQACLAGPMPPLCYGLCSSGQLCEPDLDLCMGKCELSLAAGGLAAQACEFASQCQTPGLCDGLDPAAAPAECVQACATVPADTCGDQPDGCVAACQGLFVGAGATDPAMPLCIAQQLGPTCFVESAYWNCQNFGP